MSASSQSTYTLNGYSVRESRRARRVSLRVSRMAEVDIVVPCGYPQERLLEWVKTQQAWIDRTVKKVEQERRSRPQESQETLPTKIVLRSLSEEWTVHYEADEGENIRLQVLSAQKLMLKGRIDHEPTCHDLLQQWVRQQAKYYLPQWLREISRETGLRYQKATVRRQKTLWGSCSNQANISLNDKLLFLPFPLVRYVLVHELCHTRHLNHSDAFWALVGRKEP
ncbi:MAG: M48 family metallopeptidase, partial [Merismopedia sp. SIO2A8]|nr:M48 family metallopeptidase [Merismopedia sp. SIO2A8]